MITGFGGATVWSEDLNNLLPFYRDTLGLKPSMEMPDFVLFGEMTGPTLSLGTHSEVKGPNQDPARHMVAVITSDINADVARLKAAGVEFLGEPEHFDPVIVATCKDPEGNYVQLIQIVGGG